MSTDLNLNVPVDVKNDADLDRLNHKLDDTSDKADEVGQRGSRGFDLMKGAAIGFGVGLATLGIDAVMDGVGNSIDLASDKAEAASKVNVLFADSAGLIEEKSKSAATAVGLSSGKYLEAAGNVGNLITNLGFAGDEAANMTTDIVQLSADLGSFNNLPTDQAVEAIGAAFRGETEPIRAFGVMLDEAAIKAKALELGLYDGVGALDKNAKATATYQLILEQTTSAQGDFARTSDGLANSQRINAARLEDAWTRVGERLEPLAAEILPMIADGLVFLVDGIGSVIDAVGEWADDNQDLLDTLSDIAQAVFSFYTQYLSVLIDVIGELGYRVGGIIGLFVDLTGAIIDSGDAILRLFQGDFEGAAAAGERALTRLQGFQENVQRAMGDTARAMADTAAEGWQELPETVESAASDAINQLAGGYAAGVPKIDAATDNLIEPLPDNVEEGQRQAARIAAQTPGEMAASLRSGRDDWRGALDLLKDDLKTSMEKGQEIAELKSVLTGKAIARGLNSTDPIVRAQAQETVDLINARLATLEGVGFDAGSAAGRAVVRGLHDSDASVRSWAALAARALQANLQTHSPADEGPLSEDGGPERWMERLGGNMGKGLERGWDGAIGDFAFAGDRFGGGFRVPAAAMARGGGDTYSITVQTGVGDPVAIGREVVSSIQAFERSGGRDWRSD